MTSGKDLPIVGWRERVSLPDWGLRGLRAKIDTGARTSAIDVSCIEELPDGQIRFEVVARVTPTRKTRWVTATPSRSSRVRPSHGSVQERFVCRTTMRLGDHEQEIELSLVCRQNMLCRMLIGRSALSSRFLIDPERKYLLTTRAKQDPGAEP